VENLVITVDHQIPAPLSEHLPMRTAMLGVRVLVRFRERAEASIGQYLMKLPDQHDQHTHQVPPRKFPSLP
jgi:hypothetical protein